MKNKFTLRYPTFRIVVNTSIIFLLIILVAFFIYRERIFFLAFWIGFGCLMGIVLLPIIGITMIMQYSVTFDSIGKKAIYRRWFYKREIPYSNLGLKRQEREWVNVDSQLITNLIYFLLYFILGKSGKAIYSLYVSDGVKTIQIADSIFLDKIEKLQNKINDYLRV